jgi:hypothetical protein
MQQEEPSETGGLSKRSADIVVALILLGVGVLVLVDSMRLGYGTVDGQPQSGYFPFYIGLLIIVSSLGTIAVNIVGWHRRREVFVRRAQLLDVLKILIPTAIFVALIGFLGIYVSMALFIGSFMRWLGRFPLYRIVLVALLVPFALFVLFEIWFLVPLPKGPLEDYLGY